MDMGDSSEKKLDLSHMQCFEKTPIAASQSEIVIKYLVHLKFTANPEILEKYCKSRNKVLARVYGNLELSVNEKFVAYGTMVKILATLRSSYAKASMLFNTKT